MDRIQGATLEIGLLIKSYLPDQPSKTQEDLGAPKTEDLDTE